MNGDPSRILLINGHPDGAPERLCAALADAYARGAVEAGHEVRRVDLGALDVPLLLSQTEFAMPPPDHIRAIRADFLWASHIVIVFPLWLGGAPAKLKALFEQLMRQSFGFDIGPQGMNARLAGRSARLVVTMGMPDVVYRLVFGAQGVLSLERGILRLTGVGPVRRSLLGRVASVTPARRQRWLSWMEQLGRRAR